MQPLKALEASARWVIRRIRASSGSLRRAATGLLVLLVVLIGGYALFAHAPYVFRGARDGKIIVNSPTVYTRQRLVNDRLSQAAWLQRQLKVTDEYDATFRSVDQVQVFTTSSGSKLGLIFGTGAPAAAPSSSPPTEAAKTPARAPDETSGGPAPLVVPTTTDLFRAKNAYREEVRAEIMETQLDDRHDIHGNTVYRLAFDATLLPGTREDSLAFIKVRLSHDWQNRKEKILNNDYAELYQEWVRYTQRVIDDSVGPISRSISDGNFALDPHEHSTIMKFLSRGICFFLFERKMIDSDKSHAARDLPPQDVIYNPDQKEHVCNERRSSTASKKADQFLQDYINAYLEQRERYFDAKLKQLIAQSSQSQSMDDAFETAKPVCKSLNPFDPNRKVPIPTNPPFDMDCPKYDLTSEGVRGGMLLLESLIRRDFNLTMQQIIDKIRGTCPDHAPRPCKTLLAPTQADVDCFAADYMVASVNTFYGRTQDEWEDLRYFMDMSVIGREIGNCRIVVSPKSIQQESEPAAQGKLTQPGAPGASTTAGKSGIHTPPIKRRALVGDPCKVNDPSDRLRCWLNQTTELYSYSVTPKNLVQRISTAADTSSALQAVVNARIDVQSRDFQSLGEAFRKQSREGRAIQSTPIVVGFGSDSGPAPRNSTEFGWVIDPPLTVDGTRAQIDEQYALAAVISVPTWWRTVWLEIERCWISRSRLHPDERITQCRPDERTVDIVRLPGDVRGISEKLRFDVRQEPHFDTTTATPPGSPPNIQVEVGQPAQVLLTGGRLWRSTTVTLGAQMADEIMVLPNMEGIVATFRCISPQTFLLGYNEITSEEDYFLAPKRKSGSRREDVAKSNVGTTSPADEGAEVKGQAGKETGGARSKTDSANEGNIGALDQAVTTRIRSRIVPIRAWTSEGVAGPAYAMVVLRGQMDAIINTAVANKDDGLRLPIICPSDLELARTLAFGNSPKPKQDKGSEHK